MVFCKKVQDYGDHAEYAFGASISDMSGTLTVYPDKPPEITSKPVEMSVSYLWIAKLFDKYKKEFEQGTFRDKIAYEC